MARGRGLDRSIAHQIPGRADHGGGVHAVAGAKDFLGSVGHEGIPNAHPGDGDVGHPGVGQRLQHRGAEAAHKHMLLHRHHPSHGTGQRQDALDVQRLDEPGVHHRGRNAVAFQHFPRGQRLLGGPAGGEEQDVFPVGQQFRPADGNRFGPRGQGNAHGAAPGIAQGHGTVVPDGGDQHSTQLIFIPGAHDRHVGQSPEIAEVEEAVVGGAVFAHDAAPIQGEHHRKPLDADVMENLVEGPLQKGGIDGHHRAHAFGGQPRREGDPVLFRDPHVVKPVRIFFREFGQPRSFGHGGGDGNDARIGFGQFHHGFAEHRGVCGHRDAFFDADAGFLFKTADPVEIDGILLGRFVSLALAGGDVEQHRLFEVLDVLQNVDEVRQLVAVDGTKIVEVEGLEQHAGGDESFERFLGPFGELVHVVADFGQGSKKFPEFFSEALEVAGRERSAEKGGEGADVGRNGHVVVVEDDDQVPVFPQRARLVEPFVGQPGRHGAVADHRHNPGFVLVVPFSAGHAQTGGDGGAAVAGGEGVVGTFAHLGEAAQPVQLAEGIETVPTTGQQFVGVGLMAHVPNQLVLGRIQDVMQGDGQLHRAEARRQMAARSGHHVDDRPPDFFGQPGQVAHGNFLEIGRGVNGGKQGRAHGYCSRPGGAAGGGPGMPEKVVGFGEGKKPIIRSPRRLPETVGTRLRRRALP